MYENPWLLQTLQNILQNAEKAIKIVPETPVSIGKITKTIFKN